LLVFCLSSILISDNTYNVFLKCRYKIEDEYDLAIFNDAYSEYLKDGGKSRPIQELWDELNL